METTWELFRDSLTTRAFDKEVRYVRHWVGPSMQIGVVLVQCWTQAEIDAYAEACRYHRIQLYKFDKEAKKYVPL